MAGRIRYLLAYDIRDPRRLRRVHQTAKAWGEALQYSVFVCDLTKSELIMLKQDLIEDINPREDSVGIFDLGAPEDRGVECIEFIGTRRTLPTADAEVW